MRLHLIDTSAHVYEPLGPIISLDNRYKPVCFSAPAGTYRIEVGKAGPGPLTFTQPYTDTSLSHLTAEFVRWGPWLLGIGTLLGITAIILLLHSSPGMPTREA